MNHAALRYRISRGAHLVSVSPTANSNDGSTRQSEHDVFMRGTVNENFKQAWQQLEIQEGQGKACIRYPAEKFTRRSVRENHADWYQHHATTALAEHLFLSPFAYQYELRVDAIPSVALRAFFQGPTFADCLTVKDAVVYAAILGVTGDALFNKMFAYGSTSSLQLGGPHMGWDLLKPVKYSWLSSLFGKNGRVGQRPVQIGDCVYFQGVKGYNRKHPTGRFPGHHMMMVGTDPKTGDQLFSGFGLDAPRSEKWVRKFLLDAYNASPAHRPGRLSQFFVRGKRNLGAVRGYLPSQSRRLDLNRLQIMAAQAGFPAEATVR